MARIRTIKPTFFTSLTIAELSLSARLTFIGLWTHVDDEGRCVYEPRLIKAALWPLDDRTSSDVDADIQELTEHSLIVQYVVGERSYLSVNGWSEHQRINRKTKSALPGPELAENSPDSNVSAGQDTLTEDSLNDHEPVSEDVHREGKGREGKGKEERTADADAAKPETIEHRVTDAAYQAVGKAFNFIAVRGIAKWAIHDRETDPQRVHDGIIDLYNMGKPITKQTLGQWLDGKLAGPRQGQRTAKPVIQQWVHY